MNERLKQELIYIVSFLGFIAFVGFDHQLLEKSKLTEVSALSVLTTEAPPSLTSGQSKQFDGGGALSVVNITPPEDQKTEKIKESIKEAFGKDWRVAYAIALAEHSGSIDPMAINSTEVENSVGVFQINIARNFGNGAWVHWNKIPGDTLEEKEEWLKDIDNNVMMARFIYGTSGFSQWATYKNGKYKEFLE